jgi:hypothetical protein
MNDEYVKELEATVRKFMTPLKDVPFPVVIKALSGFSVIPFGGRSREDKILLGKLKKGMQIATDSAYATGIFTDRPNEAGNHIEPFVRSALTEIGMKATVPITKQGKHKVAGYPDIEIKDNYNRVTYLECKTYNFKSKGSSFRTFYFQPSDEFKITTDARHLLVGFEIKTAVRSGKTAFVPISWHIYTLEKLRVQVKHEFNASNKQLYLTDALLAEGSVLNK